MEKQYSPDMVARNVKQLGNGVIEVRRYTDGHLRADLSWVWFLGMVGVLIYDYFTTQSMINDMKWAISVDWALEVNWEFHMKNQIALGNEIPIDYYEKYKAGMIRMHSSTYYWGWFYILFLLFWFYMVISPRWRAVRFDSKRRLVYFWDWGRLYILRYPTSATRYGELAYALEADMYTPWIRRAEHGALEIHLPHENRQKTKKRRLLLGIYRPACPYQNYALLEFIQDYLNSYNPDEEFARYFQKEKRIPSDYFNFFYQFSLFPQRGYNETKTEKRIQAWLDKHG